MSSPFTCVIMGSESLLIQCGQILIDRGHGIQAVVSDDARIRDWATGAGLNAIAPDRSLEQALRTLDFDYFFSITNLSLVPEAVLEQAGRAAINFHDGPLPRYAGMYAPAWALMRRETEYGISFHEMTAGVDEGDLYLQRHFELSPGETSLTLNTKCYAAAIDAFGELVDGLASGQLEPRPQDLAQRSYSGRHDRPDAAATLDWERGSEELEALVRALDFGRYENPLAAAKLCHRGRACIVGSARAVEGSAAPATVIDIGDEELVVATADGALAIGGLATPGGRPLPIEELCADLGLRRGERIEGLDPETARRLTELNSVLCRSEAFWVRRLSQLTPVEIPYVRNDASAGADGPRTASLEIPVPPAFAQAHDDDGGALIAAFAICLARLGGRTRFDLSYADAELRERGAGLEGLVADRVPLRVDLDPGASGAGAIEKVLGSHQLTCKHGSFLRDVIARYPQLREHPDLAAGRLVPVHVERLGAGESFRPPADVQVALVLEDGGRQVRLVHDERALDAAGAGELRDRLVTVLETLAADPGQALREIPLLDDALRERVLAAWNRTALDYPREACVHELFELRARSTPDATALVFEGEQLSYSELARRAGELAAHLQGLGVGPGRLVGLYVDRSLEMVVAMLGVLRAGGAYVPLDPAYPPDRVAYMLQDSAAGVVLTQEHLLPSLPGSDAQVIALDRDRELIASAGEPAAAGATPSDLAYVIYTSGSTGRPKGVMVEHRNLVNFFAGMDTCIPHDPPGTWLAVTSLSFDIAVLELLWTLTRGFEVVVYRDRDRDIAAPVAGGAGTGRPLDFALMMWGSDAGPGPRKYKLMLESAKFADENGFSAILTPERHFHAFGGPYPNPSVTSAAIAAVTSRVRIRAGSCVVPLHHPARVAEEWAVVDNISAGRVEISFASGWQPNDFVLRPGAFETAKTGLVEAIETVRRLWRGEAVEFDNPMGQAVPTATLPRPVQEELPCWVTTAGSVETFRLAGSAGHNVLTHLLGQSLEEVTEKIAEYRRARADAGHDPATGKVSLMLHTFVGDDDEQVKELVRDPIKEYLASSVSLLKGFAWAFPAFKRVGEPDAEPGDVDLDSLSADEMDTILEFAFERYYETSGLFGTPETCARMVEATRAANVDEIVCLIDYGLPTETVLDSLKPLRVVLERANRRASGDAMDLSVGTQIERHDVSHLQCTPSMARMLLSDPGARSGLARVRHLMIGGEAFPTSLAAELDGVVGGDITNMYGPTETTIWSSTQRVSGSPSSIPIGRPIANTQLYIVDESLQPQPPGVPGELLIGGDGVVRGYLERPELTAERFIPDPFSDAPGARLYRTGDLARWAPDGTVEFLGRMDFQVKIRGYRIELGEIETALGRIPGVRECVVSAREDTPGDQRLVAYLVADGSAPSDDELRSALRTGLPEFMLPSAFVELDRLPLTPNGKVDRNALPAPGAPRGRPEAEFVAPDGELEEQIAKTWKSVLQVESVGIDDNFFDLGGHSLLVVQVHRLLRDACPRPVSLTDLYRFPTIRGLAAHLGADEEPGEGVKRSQDRAAKRRQARGRRRRRDPRD